MNGHPLSISGSYITVVVHPDAAIRMPIILALSQAGSWHVHGVSNGTDAVSTALAVFPQLILLDPHLPGMDGAATLATLRAHGIACPVVALVQHNHDTLYLWNVRGYAGAVELAGGPQQLMSQLHLLLAPG